MCFHISDFSGRLILYAVISRDRGGCGLWIAARPVAYRETSGSLRSRTPVKNESARCIGAQHAHGAAWRGVDRCYYLLAGRDAHSPQWHSRNMRMRGGNRHAHVHVSRYNTSPLPPTALLQVVSVYVVVLRDVARWKLCARRGWDGPTQRRRLGRPNAAQAAGRVAHASPKPERYTALPADLSFSSTAAAMPRVGRSSRHEP